MRLGKRRSVIRKRKCFGRRRSISFTPTTSTFSPGAPKPTATYEFRDQDTVALNVRVQRKTPEATEAVRNTLRREASRKQRVLDPRSLIAAEFMILATSLPAESDPAQEVLAVYRLRWQIELAFKRLKSLLHLGKLRTKTAAGTRCWLYAHLVVALLGDDLSQDVLESFPSGVA